MANREEISSDLSGKSNNINKLSEFYRDHINLKEYLLSVDKEEREEDLRFKLKKLVFSS